MEMREAEKSRYHALSRFWWGEAKKRAGEGEEERGVILESFSKQQT